ncbi:MULTISPECIES: heavy metal sensor histidine kinase [unclassified Pseudomonas]|uniref:heavy metal sensor histidine kinase n=1 Tax=unclassified Pseudomonas TaxID=196821 RepID=UPI000BD8FC78|nr:two-component system heavy metal sensor histidine kinase CusS [Pseudomonas sp. URIL14HWK12:I12]PVZ27485.1 two-component system heavy metal sensor histidine kinase CusS [Pseudomonas sp. URIL14HWK12:I10]PVZ38374.1 two-component system heavy metal sensor histidine kinase CusS [Pseudomonas sp. URIL14HWK12:I11]SNZ03611.1 two-component system, OmpR family, heavy metal sensor histidine kinase CusS [Pseudomonas sp. URIL14HWK12:I9]
MRQPLSNRLGLLFAACTASVSLLAGVLFTRASETHFLELDEQLLSSRLQALEPVLSGTHSGTLVQSRSRLQAALGHQGDLSLRVLGPSGEHWFDDRPDLPEAAPSIRLQRVQSDGVDYRVLQQPVGTDGATAQLWLDITHHQHFLARVQQLIWLTMALSALATALLGAWAARRGLRPLRRMGEVAAGVSAQSLTTRLPEHALPAELAEVASAFNAMLGRLEGAFERLSGFSADIAHELRTPLSNLLTHTQVTLSQPRALAEYREALHGNLEELQHLAQLVNDMLLLAKADNGLLPTQAEPLALEAEADALVEYYALLAEDAGVQLRRTGHGQARADRMLLRRALSNLLDNALRFTPEGGSIVVDVADGRMSVSNSGAPISPEHCHRVFDRFYRADTARNEGGAEHAGLGLAIARSILRAHGGELECVPWAGGARFELRLPPHS